MFDIAEKSELSWLSSLESPAVRIQNQRLYAPLLNVSEAVNICRVGQNNRVCTPSMTVCMVISLLMILYIRMYGFGHLHNICSPTDWLINSALIMPGLRKAVSAPAACSCHTHTHTHTNTHTHAHTHTHTHTHAQHTHAVRAEARLHATSVRLCTAPTTTCPPANAKQSRATELFRAHLQ